MRSRPTSGPRTIRWPSPAAGFVWYEVAGITPSRERTLDEVKDRVEARWRDDEIAKRLDAKTTEIVDKLKAGTPLADVAGADQLMVETKFGLKRQEAAILPAAAIARIFRTPKDGIGSADGKTPTERIIFKVTDIKEPSFEAGGAAAKPLQDQLRSSYGDELLSQYVVRLETDLDTNINQQALTRARPSAAEPQAQTPELRDPERPRSRLASMQIEPSAGVFAASYARGATQVVWTTLVADLDTPVSAFLKTGADKKLSFLLESVEGGAVRGRYSIIGLDPDVVWRARGTRAEINRARTRRARRLRALPRAAARGLARLRQ